MNITLPVSSAISGVEFQFLKDEEAKAVSVRRITNPVTFDSLLHPTPHGLYDPALGSFLDNRCTTCNLNSFDGCPGHCGHIELPVPVYHVMFMDQCLRLLRAKCAYCHCLRMPLVEVNRYSCMLRLLRYGLLKEAGEIGAMRKVPEKYSKAEAEESGNEDSSDNIMEVRDKLTAKWVKHAARAQEKKGWSVEHTEAISVARKDVIKDFLAQIVKYQKCTRCKGISPTYRKDRSSKIFRNPLSARSKAAMSMLGMKASLPHVILRERQQQEAMGKDKMKDVHADEGVADMDGTESDSSEEGESTEEREDGDGDVVSAEATIASSKTKGITEEEKQTYMTTEEVRAAITLLFEKEAEILGIVYSPGTQSQKIAPPNANMFFLKTLIVPPNKYRPENRATGGTGIVENQRNSSYRSILQSAEQLTRIRLALKGTDDNQDPNRRKSTIDDLHNAWIRLQEAVNSLLDSDKNPVQGAAAKNNPEGIKQRLEKKEGLFRMNMMGKRVNFAARSVISPDPNIETNEIGVPPVFARRLTYPEPVTNHNFYELKQAVINGPDIHPGAIAVETETGQVISLKRKSAEERVAMANQLLAPSNTSVNGAKNKKVHRHLNNGDVVIMNRQPTLHKPSMMVHRARVLNGEKTIRMHYSNCNTYNADFDGDEMNMHFPQNETARAEAMTIADTDHQYLSGTAGSPLRGLIQDHISICVWLTNKDMFFNREEYQNLIYSALRPESGHATYGTLLTVTPAILKPVPIWTGKQVVSTIMKNIKPHSHPGLTFDSKSRTSANQWGLKGSEEGVVIFDDGDFLCGVLDKKQIGPSHGGFVSAVYEAYGHTTAGRLLSVLGRLLTKLLNMRAFSCGVEDLVLTSQGNAARREVLKGADELGLKVAAKYVSLAEGINSSDDPELKRRLEDVLRDDAKQQGLDMIMNSTSKDLSSGVTNACLPSTLIRQFPKNQMQVMTGSGAKGSDVNANLISCNLGQQVLEGRRVPIMSSGKSLPCFKPFEPSIRAGGFITDRFLTGIRPQEYYFHAMAGREGLIDTAVKTSRSGYLQRCVVKNMEGLRAEYDASVRDADGSIIQFLYGEDGLDITKQVYLNDFKFLANNFLSVAENLDVREHFSRLENKEAAEYTKNAWKKFMKTGDSGATDPGLARFTPNRFAGAVSEKFFEAKRKYIEENPDKLMKKNKTDTLGKVGKKNFENALNMKYLKSIVEPGEAVGVVAGQSIGEPSTQMTLNTFHLAGHSAKNVTLGIPRLREIVMTASANISTPSMTMHLQEGVTKEMGETLAKEISRLSLAEVIDKASVTETLGEGVGYGEARTYKIRLDFFPSAEYCKEYAIEIQDILRTLEFRFIPTLSKLIKKEMKKKSDESDSGDALPELGVSAGTVEQQRVQTTQKTRTDEDEEEGEEEDEDDATAAKARANRAEGEDFDDPDEEEEEIRREGSLDAESDTDEAYGSGEGSEAAASASDSDASTSSQKPKSKKKQRRVMSKQDAKELESRIKTENAAVTAFKFDAQSASFCEINFEYSAGTAKLLMLHLVEDVLHQTNIRAIPGLKSCQYIVEKTGKIETPIIATEGENLLSIRSYQDIINPNKLFTNDIHAMLRLYGVEAARATIIQEMAGVFGGHGIDVDTRHLNLIADTMTREGGFKSFSRRGLEGNTSPFMKMSFETTVGFLKDAILMGEGDDLSNPSARIVTGRLNRVGTGAFDVLVPVGGG